MSSRKSVSMTSTASTCSRVSGVSGPHVEQNPLVRNGFHPTSPAATLEGNATVIQQNPTASIVRAPTFIDSPFTDAVRKGKEQTRVPMPVTDCSIGNYIHEREDKRLGEQTFVRARGIVRARDTWASSERIRPFYWMPARSFARLNVRVRARASEQRAH